MKTMKKNFKRLMVCLFLTVLMALISGCQDKPPVKLGFSGCLTGKLSDLGTGGRDGAILAVEQINQAGGISGHPLQLIIRDDKHDPATAIQVDKELIQEGVAAIIGHMTITMSMSVIHLINKEKVVMISPTTSTNRLAGIDDCFFSVCPPSKAESVHLARHMSGKMKLKTLACAYDLSNRAFTEGWYQHLKAKFEDMGGQLIFFTTFTSGQPFSYLTLAQDLLASEADGLVLAASALDTAMICQQLAKIGSDIPVVSSGWANTPAFIHHGGTAVEGVLFSQTFNSKSNEASFLSFKKQFMERFGREPNFAAACGYDAVQLFFNGLSRADHAGSLRDALKNSRIDAVQGELEIDAYGDATHRRFLVTVRNGQFEVME